MALVPGRGRGDGANPRAGMRGMPWTPPPVARRPGRWRRARPSEIATPPSLAPDLGYRGPLFWIARYVDGCQVPRPGGAGADRQQPAIRVVFGWHRRDQVTDAQRGTDQTRRRSRGTRTRTGRVPRNRGDRSEPAALFPGQGGSPFDEVWGTCRRRATMRGSAACVGRDPRRGARGPSTARPRTPRRPSGANRPPAAAIGTLFATRRRGDGRGHERQGG